MSPAAASAQAQFPTRPVRIVVTFPAGGTVDAAMRVVAQQRMTREELAKWAAVAKESGMKID